MLEEHGALADLVERVAPAGGDSDSDGGGVCVCAAEICYDKAVVDSLFGAVALLWTRRGGAPRAPHADDRLLFARSSHFEHMDESTLQRAARHGLHLHARTRRCTPGVLDCFASSGFTGSADDDVEVFTFIPARGTDST